MNDEQALWDLEDAAIHRERVRAASKKVLDTDASVLAARGACREAAAALAAAESAVTDWTLTLEPMPPNIFLQCLRVLDGELRRAENELRRVKYELNLARAARGRAWDERRVCIRGKFETYPLEEFAARQQASGECVPEEEPAPTPLPAACRHCGKRRASSITGICDYCENDPALYPYQVRYRNKSGPFHVKDRGGLGVAAASFETLAEAEADAARRNADHQAATAQPPSSSPSAAEPEGEPWPSGLTDDVLKKSYIAPQLAGPVKRIKHGALSPAAANPFVWEGRLWICTSMSEVVGEVLPLLPLGEFEEIYPNYPTKYRPDCPPAGSREERLQFHTGVVVQVGKEQYVVAPAGERRTLSRVKGKTP